MRFKFALISAVALLVSACSSHVSSDVSRFNEMPAPTGQSVTVVAMDAEHQDGLEFAKYQELVSDALVAQGYKAATDGGDLTASIKFSRSEGQKRWVPISGPLSNDRYWRSHRAFWWGYSSFYDPFYDNRDDLVRRIYYTHTLKVFINDSNGKRVFEGAVISENRYKSLPEVMPYLIEAMFVDFPGKSGETKRIVLKKDKE